MWVRAAAFVFALGGVALSTAGCDAGHKLSSSGLGGRSQDRDSDAIACEADADCLSGETCSQGVCQMKRCGEPDYASVAPLGNVGFFKRDREIVLAESSGALRGYEPRDRTFLGAGASWLGTTGQVIDVAGGNFTGRRPEGVAMIVQGVSSVTIRNNASETVIPLNFVPVAIAAGDIDADGIDDVVALSEAGTVAGCNPATKECVYVTVGVGVRATDVAAGDLDGDGFAEAVVLAGGSLGVVNFDTAKTGHKASHVVTTPVGVLTGMSHALTRIALGDLDADGKDDLLALEDTWGGDEIHVVEIGELEATIRTTASVSNGATDVAVGAFGADEPMAAVLGSDDTVEMLAIVQGALLSRYKSVVSGASGGARITLADLDGNSPMRVLRGQPRLLPGRVVPMAVLTLPPYSRTYSDGVSSAEMGSSESKEHIDIDTVLMRAQVGLAFGGELGSVVEAEISGWFARETWTFSGKSRSVEIGGSFEVEAQPDKQGFSGGAVMLGCACYHQYTYVVDDPAGVLGGGIDGKTIDVLVPVGGQTSVWSTRRYNALAAALRDLPKIQIPYQIGQVASYPQSPKTLDGKPIPDEDMVFEKPPTYRTSDVAAVNFELSVGNGKTREHHVLQGGGAALEVSAFGVTASAEVEATIGKGYWLAIGKSTVFSGTVPTVSNDPTTPEDEFGLYGYSFTPIVYRHRYLTADRQPSAFYVLTYAVGK